MAWTPYLVSFRILSPIHIGWKKLGNLQMTRPYVTGKTLWGALTARLVRDEGNDNYKKIGDKVDGELRFSYFYPSIDTDKVEMWPWRHENTEEDFAWTFLGSYVSTSVDGDTAEEGSLHEIEYISSVTRNGDQAFLVGYVIEKEGCQLKWKGALKRIQIGGDRGYGWGRTELISEPKKVEKCFDYVIDASKSSPTITVLEDKPILAHALADGLICKGVIEPLVGRETNDSKGFGGTVSSSMVCHAPGGIVQERTSFTIQSKGIWLKDGGNSSGDSNP